MHNYIYIHVCCINNWKDVLNNLYFNIKSSGLYEVVSRIKFSVLCNPESKTETELYFSNFLLLDAKIELLEIACNISLYETHTINLLHKHATESEEDFNVLYLHTKGVTRTGVNVADWIKYMIYFNINQYQTCIDRLAHHDAVGVNLITIPKLHYSGNFWWSKSSYIRKLQPCQHIHYNSPEFWLTEHGLGSFLSLWNSNINHYNERYEEDKYENKIHETTNNGLIVLEK